MCTTITDAPCKQFSYRRILLTLISATPCLSLFCTCLLAPSRCRIRMDASLSLVAAISLGYGSDRTINV
jgi:hypothetical protein